MRIAEIITSSITALAAAVGAATALAGLNAWKKQLKGKNDYELARRYLRAVYGLRDALKFVRFGFISSEEISSAMKVKNTDKSIPGSKDASRAVYSLRWEKVTEAVSDLEVELREAEISWGKNALETEKDLDACKVELFINLKKFLDYYDANLSYDRDIIYDQGDDDKYNTKLNVAVSKIENYLKPHLK